MADKDLSRDGSVSIGITDQTKTFEEIVKLQADRMILTDKPVNLKKAVD